MGTIQAANFSDHRCNLGAGFAYRLLHERQYRRPNRHDRHRCLLYPSRADIGRNLATTLSLSTDNTKHMDLQMDKLSAAGLVRAYRRRELSPVEVTQAVLQRI